MPSEVRRIERRVAEIAKPGSDRREAGLCANAFVTGVPSVQDQTGTGMVSTMSRTMRSACSKLCARMPWARLSMTRWDKHDRRQFLDVVGRQ